MARLLLHLHQVPDDERIEVCDLLDAHGIAWYATEPSPWGVSHGALWVREDAELEQAQQVLAEHARERSTRVRAEYAAARAAGTAPTLWDEVRARPAFVLLALLGIAFALALVVVPVWLLAA